MKWVTEETACVCPYLGLDLRGGLWWGAGRSFELIRLLFWFSVVSVTREMKTSS